MHTTYQPSGVPGADTYRRFGLTHPAIIDAYVTRRINDPSLLTSAAGPRYADFFTADN